MSSKRSVPISHRLFPGLHLGSSKNRYLTLFVTLFALSIFFCLTDFATTAMALSRGLAEGNLLVLRIASSTGLSVLGVLELTKATFILGCAAACAIGVRTKGGQTGLIAMGLLVVLILLQAAVSLSNYLLIAG